jgi:hypothetical protein
MQRLRLYARVRETGMRGHEMAEARLPAWLLRQLGAVDREGQLNPAYREWSMAEIHVGDHPVICFIPRLLFVDLSDPEQIYQG